MIPTEWADAVIASPIVISTQSIQLLGRDTLSSQSIVLHSNSKEQIVIYLNQSWKTLYHWTVNDLWWQGVPSSRQ